MGNRRQDLEERIRPLTAIAEAVESAREADKLLTKVWNWIGPYGVDRPHDVPTEFIFSPNGQKLVKALSMPDELRYELQRYFGFDDSE